MKHPSINLGLNQILLIYYFIGLNYSDYDTLMISIFWYVYLFSLNITVSKKKYSSECDFLIEEVRVKLTVTVTFRIKII